MPPKFFIPIQIIGTIHDVQLPPDRSRPLIGRRPVSLQICVHGPAGRTYEWFSVNVELRQRIYDLARHDKLPMDTRFAFMIDQNGAILGFTVVP